MILRNEEGIVKIILPPCGKDFPAGRTELGLC